MCCQCSSVQYWCTCAVWKRSIGICGLTELSWPAVTLDSVHATLDSVSNKQAVTQRAFTQIHLCVLYWQECFNDICLEGHLFCARLSSSTFCCTVMFVTVTTVHVLLLSHTVRTVCRKIVELYSRCTAVQLYCRHWTVPVSSVCSTIRGMQMKIFNLQASIQCTCCGIRSLSSLHSYQLIAEHW